MKKYYTRACNFYYGVNAKKLIKKKIALPLCGNQNIAFDKIEIIVRKKNKVISKVISLRKIHTLSTSCKNKLKHDLKNILMKRKNYLNNVNILEPSIMGILNLTPDSFSDGGKFNSRKKSYIHITNMIKSGAEIIDVGGESTRPWSKTIDPRVEWKRVKYVIKKNKVNLKLNFETKMKGKCLKGNNRLAKKIIKWKPKKSSFIAADEIYKSL